MIEANRSQRWSLVGAAATVLVSLALPSEAFVRILICEIACLTFIWCGEMIGRFIGLGITQETPGCVVVAIGWSAQVLLFLAVAAAVVLGMTHR